MIQNATSPRRKAGKQEIAEHFLALRGGSSDEKLAATAKYFGRTPQTVQNIIKFWLSGPEYLRYFPDKRQRDKRRWHMPPTKVVETLNRQGSISKAAKALKTTPITLTKFMERERIVQIWQIED